MEIENRANFSNSNTGLESSNKKYHPNIYTLGKNTRSIMGRMGLTIDKIADRANLHYATVRVLTSGTGNPTLDTTYRILECLNVNPDLNELASTDERDRELSDVIYYFQNLQDEEKKIAISLLQALSYLKFGHNRDRTFIMLYMHLQVLRNDMSDYHGQC